MIDPMSRSRARPRTGGLLVATHDLVDPNFDGAVVLLLDHDDEGTLGVVLNRPGMSEVTELLPAWSAAAGSPGVLFDGGPVGPDTVVAIGVGNVTVPDAWQPVADRLGVVDLAEPPPQGLEQVRVFVGYAGWGPGQLEQEVAEGAWWVVDAEPSDLTTPRPERLWRTVLVRQGGLFATIPDDPTLN